MFQTKKSLGQNFLNSDKILEKIIQTADLKTDDVVLEVGPGKGVLTEKLLEKVKKVIAVEKDNRLIEYLQKKFADEIKNGKLEIINTDILNLPITTNNSGDLKVQSPKKLFGGDYKIVANIPFYITGQFLRKFLSADFPPSKMIVMLQKEVAQRICPDLDIPCPSREKESVLSLSVKAYGKPRYIQTVKAENFSPKPKVDSAILLIDNISKNFFKDMDENAFFQLIKLGFSSKRKMLINNLSQKNKKTSTAGLKAEFSSGRGKEQLIQIFEKLDLSAKIRAENLSLQDWKNLYFCLSNLLNNPTAKQ